MSQNPFEILTSPEHTNRVIENVLLITLNEDNPNNLFIMSAGNSEHTKLWTMELIELNLFERLMSFPLGKDDNSKVILYLYNSFLRLQEEIRECKTEVTGFLSLIIIRNIATAMKQPELFVEQNISQQIIEIFQLDDSKSDDRFSDSSTVRDEFLSLAIKKAFEDSDEDMKRNIRETVYGCFDECFRVVRKATLINLDGWIVTFLTAFVKDKNNPDMAGLYLDYITLPPNCDGIKYADSLLGET